jgi:hypothetical protein
LQLTPFNICTHPIHHSISMTRPPVQQHGSRVQAGTRAAAAGPLIVHGLLASSMAAECRHTAKQQQVCGQISHRRRVSSKLVFYDLLQSDTSQWWEVVVKAGTYGDVQAVKDLRDSLKLGDCVEVTGWAEGDAGHSPTLQAVSIKVTQPWRLQSPALAFIPRPAPRAHKPQQQQAESPSQATATAAEAAPTGVQQDTSSPAAAARVSAPQVAVCKFWLNTGRCVKGTDCPYLHAVLPAAGGGSVSRRNCLRQR